MIIEFSFSGIGSFRDHSSISFVADPGSHLSTSYVRSIRLANGNSLRLLRLSSLFGPNSSGKSTVLETMNLLKFLATEPFPDNYEQIRANFYTFKTQSDRSCAEIDLKFVRSGRVYRYQLQFNATAVNLESLECITTAPEGNDGDLVYKRELDPSTNHVNITFGKNTTINQSELEKLKSVLLPNTTLLAVSNRKMMINCLMIRDAYRWFKEQFIGVFSSKTDQVSWLCHQISNNCFPIKSLVFAMNQAGFPIVDLIIEKPSGINNPSKQSIHPSHSSWNAFTTYRPGNQNVYLDLRNQESPGTLKYLVMAGILQIANQDPLGSIFAIDDIEQSLHPDLIDYFLINFLNSCGDSQLIISTQYREWLQNDLLYRDDSIWFVDRDLAALTSSLYCLSQVRKSARLKDTASAYNFYKSGRFGAVPVLVDQ